jgi:hypothetical protein
MNVTMLMIQLKMVKTYKRAYSLKSLVWNEWNKIQTIQNKMIVELAIRVVWQSFVFS